MPHQNIIDFAPVEFIKNVQHGTTRKTEDGIDVLLMQGIK
jgi:hypothetical protein